MYPSLICSLDDGTIKKECDRQFICKNTPFESGARAVSYEIDWSGETTFQNWMTSLDLICEEPYKIGLMGSVSFISFSIGSLLITK